jgi:hypothetical protein
MQTHWQHLSMAVVASILCSCTAQPPEVQFVRQKIPVEIQRGKPVIVEIRSLSGNGSNDVGIRCSPDVWSALTNGSEQIIIQLRSSNKKGTEIGGISPGRGGEGKAGVGFLGYIPNVHYLFHIYGKHGAKASVEIIFPNAPEGTTRAEIIVGKTPIDTKPPSF